ncbi:hypothetical protein H4Q26_009341 [Puccinia striiformis f. sp. tritici PST-130]|nr:hypothetical protein H4Q26_009341 [Puccinia striiformis f. sp. tritici PST-130]
MFDARARDVARELASIGVIPGSSLSVPEDVGLPSEELSSDYLAGRLDQKRRIATKEEKIRMDSGYPSLREKELLEKRKEKNIWDRREDIFEKNQNFNHQPLKHYAASFPSSSSSNYDIIHPLRSTIPTAEATKHLSTHPKNLFLRAKWYHSQIKAVSKHSTCVNHPRDDTRAPLSTAYKDTLTLASPPSPTVVNNEITKLAINDDAPRTRATTPETVASNRAPSVVPSTASTGTSNDPLPSSIFPLGPITSN